MSYSSVPARAVSIRHADWTCHIARWGGAFADTARTYPSELPNNTRETFGGGFLHLTDSNYVQMENARAAVP